MRKEYRHFDSDSYGLSLFMLAAIPLKCLKIGIGSYALGVAIAAFAFLFLFAIDELLSSLRLQKRKHITYLLLVIVSMFALIIISQSPYYKSLGR